MIRIVSILLILVFIPSYAWAERLRVYLDWFKNAEFAGMLLAEDRGWYKEAGIDLQMIFTDLDIVPRVIRGEADIGMHSANEVIKYIDRGHKIKAFVAKYQLNPLCIAARRDLEIKQLSDLQGKTIGVITPQEHELHRVMFGNAGLSVDGVRFKKIEYTDEMGLIRMLRSGYIDALVAWEFNWTISFALLGYPVKVFPSYDHGFHFYGIVFFGPERFIKRKKVLLKKFWSVTVRGWREVYKNPEKYAEWVVDNWYPRNRYINGSREMTISQQRLELILRQKYFYEGVGIENIGAMSRAKWKKSLEIAKQYGIIADSSLAVDDVADFSVLRDAKGE